MPIVQRAACDQEVYQAQISWSSAHVDVPCFVPIAPDTYKRIKTPSRKHEPKARNQERTMLPLASPMHVLHPRYIPAGREWLQIKNSVTRYGTAAMSYLVFARGAVPGR